MNGNWDQLIIKAIVPLAFFAIWAFTALFNRESKGFVPRPVEPRSSMGPRPGEPTMRWSSPTAPQPPASRRMPTNDDDILLIGNDSSRQVRPAQPRPGQAGGPRRVVKSRQAPAPIKKVETPPARAKLSGVSQNVNQQLARPIELTPLTTIAPMTTTHGSDLANSPSAPSKTSTVLTISTLIPLMNDPRRLREAFIVNELFQAPLALRPARGHRR